MRYITIWISACILAIICQQASSQILTKSHTMRSICKVKYIRRIDALSGIKHCQIILGSLEINGTNSTYVDISEISLPDLTEITGFLTIYNDEKIKSLGELFPRLARIRGQELYKNYALSVYNLTNLEEIGLYSLLKIDRGAIAITLNKITCYYETIDWKMIANDSHIVIGRNVDEELGIVHERLNLNKCKSNCSCSYNPKLNYCWNKKNCQKFVDDRDGSSCHKECLGCSQTDPNKCLLCRHYTNNPDCVSTCPNGTYPEETMKYCLTASRCVKLGGWIMNNTCVRECPKYYKQINNNDINWCIPCPSCKTTCKSVHIKTISDIQKAGKCIVINGHLKIDVRVQWNIMHELRTHLKYIKLIRDFIIIENSNITDIDFLPSLKAISGLKRKNDDYVLIIRHMYYLKKLFPLDQLDKLEVIYGRAYFYDNPQLCVPDINRLGEVFKELHVPEGMNGYDLRCNNRDLSIELYKVEHHKAYFKFSHFDGYANLNLVYTRLYPGQRFTDIDPDDPCQINEWKETEIFRGGKLRVYTEIDNLTPSSMYALYVEFTTPDGMYLTRTEMYDFTTKQLRLKAPFITRAISTSPNSITFSWLTNAILRETVFNYDFEVILTDTKTEFVDICAADPMLQEFESLHEVNSQLPYNYEICTKKTYCNDLPLSEEEHYTACESNMEKHCDQVPRMPENETFGESNYHKNYYGEIDGKLNEYQIDDLAPFSVYEIVLRSCNKNYLLCSRSDRVLVRTLPEPNADLATLTYFEFINNSIINVMWNPPEHPNGHVISYELQFIPESSSPHEVVPMSLCVPGDTRNITLTSLVYDSYLVKICTSTLASNITCTKWIGITSKSQLHSWFCLVFGVFGVIIFWAVVCVFQKICFKKANPPRRRRARYSDSEDPDFSRRPSTSKSCPAFIDLEMTTYKAGPSGVRKRIIPLSDIEECSSSAQERDSEKATSSSSTDQGVSPISPEYRRIGSSMEIKNLDTPTSNTGPSSIDEDETAI